MLAMLRAQYYAAYKIIMSAKKYIEKVNAHENRASNVEEVID